LISAICAAVRPVKVVVLTLPAERPSPLSWMMSQIASWNASPLFWFTTVESWFTYSQATRSSFRDGRGARGIVL
jgi:hypothetical protein